MEKEKQDFLLPIVGGQKMLMWTQAWRLHATAPCRHRDLIAHFSMMVLCMLALSTYDYFTRRRKGKNILLEIGKPKFPFLRYRYTAAKIYNRAVFLWLECCCLKTLGSVGIER